MSNIPLKAVCEDDTMILTGDLVGSDHDFRILAEAIRHLCREYVHIYVNASKMRIIPSGFELWLDFANSALRGTTVEYIDSQLADIIKYDDEYKHNRTILPED